MGYTSLEFESQSFTDRDLKALDNIDKVRQLELRDTAVTDLGFRELLRATSLVEISISSDQLTDDAIEVLSKLPNLRSLIINHGPKIGDRGVHYLTRSLELRELYLRGTKVTDRGLAAIQDLPEVFSVVVDGAAITDEGCSKLVKLPCLTMLSLNGTSVSGAPLASLSDNAHLSIYLDGTLVTDDSVTLIAQRVSKLKLISLKETKVGDKSAYALSKLLHLNDVRLSSTQVTDDGLLAFANHPYLDAIYVKGCAVTKEAVASLKSASPRKLTVYGP